MKEKVISGKWISKKLDLDELKLYEYLIQLTCVVENKYLPVAETSLLAFYAKNGEVSRSVDKKYMNEFNRSSQIVSNLKTSLTNRGFLTKQPDASAWDLPKFLSVPKESITVIIELNAGQGSV